MKKEEKEEEDDAKNKNNNKQNKTKIKQTTNNKQQTQTQTQTQTTNNTHRTFVCVEGCAQVLAKDLVEDCAEGGNAGRPAHNLDGIDVGHIDLELLQLCAERQRHSLGPLQERRRQLLKLLASHVAICILL